MRKVLQKLAPIYEKSALFRAKNRAKPERMDSIFPEDGGDRAPCSENGVPSLERKPCKRKKLFLEKSPAKTAPVLRKERAEKMKAFVKRHKGKLIAAAGVAGAAALAAIVASTRNQSSSPVEGPMLDEADDDINEFIDNVEEPTDVASGF